MFIPRFEVCLCGSVISECINSAVQFLGYSNASPKQFEAVYNFVQGRDVFVSLPTGSGKSLCYASLPLVFDKIAKCKEYVATAGQSQSHTIVCISPLTFLILDQVQLFTKKGLHVMYVKGKDLDDGIILGHYQLLYKSPESLLAHRELFTCSIFCNNLSGLVVDEANLICKW